MTKQDSYYVGQLGERKALVWLRKQGIHSVKRNGGPGVDLIDPVNGVSYEVKGARPSDYSGGGRQVYKFCLKRKGRRGVLADFVVLVCFPLFLDKWKPIGLFIIPSQVVAGVGNITIPRNQYHLDQYRGKYREFYFPYEVSGEEQNQ